MSLHGKRRLMPALAIGFGLIAHAEGEIRTLTVSPPGQPFDTPIVSLDDPNSQVVVEFDQLSNDRSYLRYELIHCDADWNPSGLVDSEFLDSFNEGTIENYDFSNATLVPYVHYSFSLPNPDIRITAPGNYVARIFDEEDRDKTLGEARFMVCDWSMRVGGEVTSKTDIDGNDRHQQLSIVVDKRETPLRDPFNDLRVVVLQNSRTDNAVTLSTPMRVQGDKLYFEHLRPLIFPAGNEYRRFEVVSTQVPTMRIERLEYSDPLYHALVETDKPRRDQMYLYDQTHRGKFLVRQQESRGASEVDADYVAVHFVLEMPQLPDAQVYMEGDLTGRGLNPDGLMYYDNTAGCYRTTLLLKQGAYDYQYIASPGGTEAVEGDKFQTQNDYEIRVYHRPPGTRYDRLVAVGTIHS